MAFFVISLFMNILWLMTVTNIPKLYSSAYPYAAHVWLQFYTYCVGYLRQLVILLLNTVLQWGNFYFVGRHISRTSSIQYYIQNSVQSFSQVHFNYISHSSIIFTWTKFFSVLLFHFTIVWRCWSKTRSYIWKRTRYHSLEYTKH